MNPQEVLEYAKKHDAKQLDPVSYTHLDVYKRQVRGNALSRAERD